MPRVILEHTHIHLYIYIYRFTAQVKTWRTQSLQQGPICSDFGVQHDFFGPQTTFKRGRSKNNIYPLSTGSTTMTQLGPEFPMEWNGGWACALLMEMAKCCSMELEWIRLPAAPFKWGIPDPVLVIGGGPSSQNGDKWTPLTRHLLHRVGDKCCLWSPLLRWIDYGMIPMDSGSRRLRSCSFLGRINNFSWPWKMKAPTAVKIFYDLICTEFGT